MKRSSPLIASSVRKFLALALCLNALSAAAEVSFSGFGTLGYARSDQSFVYQRFIDKSGTFKRDSIFGAQMDATITPQFSATVQVRMAPALDSDTRWKASVPWAFVAYRPSNDWLLRLGKWRVPFYLNSENTDVGATFDAARLPVEVYSTSPSADLTGVTLGKTWNLGDNELNLDGYWGKTSTYWRWYRRDNVPGLDGAGPRFVPFDGRGVGLVLTWRQDENIFRAGVHSLDATTPAEPTPVTFPFVSIMPGVGYYRVSNLLPGPVSVPTLSKFNNKVYTLAADVGLGNDFRLSGEYVRRAVKEVDTGPDSQAAYLSLRKRIGKWTPYATYAWLRSESKVSNLYQAVNNNRLPAFIPGAALINVSQRFAADGIPAYDQSSLSLGTSYALSPTSKLKAEWMRTHVGKVSSLVDAPPGGDVSKTNINVLSLSYSFVF